MLADQRFVSDRSDVLTFVTEPLDGDMTLAGPVDVELEVILSTTDADFVVRLIDVFPDDDPQSGCRMLVRGDVMRGRFRDGFSRPKAFTPGVPARVPFRMTDIAHTFRAGHRVMIQVQSTWFPLAERSPQQFVDVWTCGASDFVPCKVSVLHQRSNRFVRYRVAARRKLTRFAALFRLTPRRVGMRGSHEICGMSYRMSRFFLAKSANCKKISYICCKREVPYENTRSYLSGRYGVGKHRPEPETSGADRGRRRCRCRRAARNVRHGIQTASGLRRRTGRRLVVTTMRRWAAQYGRAVVGSVVVAEQERFRNRMFFVKPSGETAWYDKRHLFRPGGEARDYTPGDRRVIVEYMGFRFLLLVCYDLRFPVWSRNRGDYDAILCSASWADDRREVWRTLLRARAIENQCYLAGVNRVGTDPDASYAGDSALIDFAGRTLADAGDRERTLIAEFDSEAQAAFKEKFPAWMDADDFELKC